MKQYIGIQPDKLRGNIDIRFKYSNIGKQTILAMQYIIYLADLLNRYPKQYDMTTLLYGWVLAFQSKLCIFIAK